MIRAARAWWSARSIRERRLLAISGALLATIGLSLVTAAIARDLATLRHRVASAERRLETARFLAGRLEAMQAGGPDDERGPLVARVETTAAQMLGRERLTRVGTTDDATAGTEVRLVDVSLDEVIHLVATLEAPDHAVLVRDLDLRRRPDAGDRYDASIVVLSAGRP